MNFIWNNHIIFLPAVHCFFELLLLKEASVESYHGFLRSSQPLFFLQIIVFYFLENILFYLVNGNRRCNYFLDC